MGHCFNCKQWITGRKTVYGDGAEIFAPTSPPGKGQCQALSIETTPEFGCNAHSHGEVHVIVTQKDGTPWQNFEYRPCPDCGGRGSTPQDRGGQPVHGAAPGGLHYRDYNRREQTPPPPQEKAAA